MDNLYYSVKQLRDILRKRVTYMESIIQQAPEGCLRVRSNDKRISYYDRFRTAEGYKTRYLSPQRPDLINKLADKYYASTVLPAMKADLAALDAFLLLHSRTDEFTIAQNIKPEIMNVCSPKVSRIKTVEDWLQRPSPLNPPHPEDLLFQTQKGDLVRSKSEVIIADILYRYGIPYRYEFPLILSDGRVRFPDFTILDPHSMKVYYWEHFGKLDDPGYGDTVCERLNQYSRHGILPGLNLIYTFETRNCPFLPQYAESLIHTFFPLFQEK